MRKILAQLENLGFILTEEHLLKYHVNMPDNRYGDLIFYVDVPFHLTTAPPWAMKKVASRFVSMHGYSPDYPNSDAVFISTKKARGYSHLELADIMPSILELFSIEIPAHVDGKVIWR